MDPLVPFVLGCVAVATASDLVALRPRRLISPAAPRTVPSPSGEAAWQPYVLLPLPHAQDDLPVREVDATVDALLAGHPTVQVVVIDRGTPGPVVARSDRVAVVHVTGPDDVSNTAAFLNAGLEVVLLDAQRRSLDPSHVVVGVVGLGSRCSRGAVDATLAAFVDGDVGGVQLRVETDDALLETMAPAAVTAWAADHVERAGPPWFGAAWVEGQGQFTRLSALLQVDQRPWWTTVEAEDLDLAASLLADGWELIAVDTARLLVPPSTTLTDVLRRRVSHQRGRLGAALRLGDLWHSRQISNPALFTITRRLLVPWFGLAGSCYLVVALMQLLLAVPRGDLGQLGIPAVTGLAYVGSRVIVTAGAWQAVAHLPIEAGSERDAALGLALSSPLTVVATLRALGRIVFRLGPLVGVDEVTTHSVGLAVPLPTRRPRRPLPPAPSGPVRLRARIHQTPSRARRRR